MLKDDQVRIWLDDMRRPPNDAWKWVRDYNEAVAALEGNAVKFISFDHDLGEGKTGYDFACKIERLASEGRIPRFEWDVHSRNPVGASRIASAMRAVERIWATSRQKH